METGSVLDQEMPLEGGRLTSGVVRVGDTVRRPGSDASAFVSTLLEHLERVGFQGAPRFLGRDEHDRDCFSFVDGWVPAKFQYFTDAQVHEAGMLLHLFHAATRGCPLLGKSTVICHHDPGPNNVVFKEARPIAFIDFDMAAPGEPLEDLGYMAWAWCISSKPTRQPVTVQCAQVRILIDGYGMDRAQRGGIFESILSRQARNIEFWEHKRKQKQSNAGIVQATLEKIDEVIDWTKREKAYTEAHRTDFISAIL